MSASHVVLTLRSRGDSYYEYLLKLWIQGGKKDVQSPVASKPTRKTDSKGVQGCGKDEYSIWMYMDVYGCIWMYMMDYGGLWWIMVDCGGLWWDGFEMDLVTFDHVLSLNKSNHQPHFFSPNVQGKETLIGRSI